jgi:hypothetical protein
VESHWRAEMTRKLGILSSWQKIALWRERQPPVKIGFLSLAIGADSST